MQTFIQYQENELYNSQTVIDRVPSRDLHAIEKISKPLPDDFTLFDAEVGSDGQPAGVHHNQARYVRADRVTSLESFKQYHEPIVAAERQRLTTRFQRFASTFLDEGFSLRRSFRAALEPRRPIIEDYIQNVESAVRACEERGLTHIAWSEPLRSAITPVTSGLRIYNRNLVIMNP